MSALSSSDLLWPGVILALGLVASFAIRTIVERLDARSRARSRAAIDALIREADEASTTSRSGPDERSSPDEAPSIGRPAAAGSIKSTE